MNKTLHTTNKVCLIAFFFLVTIYNVKAHQIVWNGSVSKSWEDGDNWSTGKVPSSNDTVTIETGSNDVNLDKPVTVKLFTMSSGVMDLQKNNLVITDKAAFASGEILNGNVIVIGTGSATFSGTLFNAKVNVSTASVFLNGSVFNDSLFVTKKGKSNDLSKGGNMFNEPVCLTDSGDGALVLSDSLTDVFKEQLIVTNVGEGAIYLAHRSRDNEFYEDVFLNGSNIFSNYYGTATYAGNIFIDSPNGEIYFGVSEGSCTLNYGKKLSIPLSTISAGKLFLRNFYSLDSLSEIKLDLAGTSSLVLETGTVFHDKVSFTAPSLFLNGATFNAIAELTNTGNSNVTSTGGCTFAKAMTLTKSGGATKIYSLSNTVQDTYHGSATFENTSGTFSLNNGLFKKKCTLKSNTTTGEGFYIAGAGSCTFKDSVVISKLDGPGMFFGGGNVLIDSASNLYFSSGIGGTAAFQKLTRAGTTPINIINGPDNLYLGPNNTFNSNFSFTGKAITLYGNTFQGATTIKVNGNTTTSSYGGNVFNGTTLIQDSSSTAHSLYLATGASDDYNGDVTFVQKGTGVSLYPAYTKNSTFAKNITLDGTTSMQLGSSGGKVILDGTTAQSITSGNTSLFPTIKKLQVNKASGSLTLYTPLTISDSLQLTQGRINTDTTNLLTIAHGGKVSGGSDNNYINGPMKKIGNTAFAFPLGSSSLIHPYHPLEITAPTNTTDAYTAIYIPTAQTIGTAIDTSIDNLNACQYWKLNRNSGTSKVKVKLGWNHDTCETISPTNFRVTGWNGSIWKDLGNSVTSGDSLQGMVQSTDSLNTITTLTLAFRKCAAFRSIITHANVSCFGVSDGAATILAKGGTSNYEYLWINQNLPRRGAENLYVGKYLVQAKDARGCILMDSVIISGPEKIVIDFTTSKSSCGDSTGEISVYPTGGNGGYKYYWLTNDDTTSQLNNIPAGSYKLIVSDARGCRVSTKINLADEDGPGINIVSQNNLACFGELTGSVEISGNDMNGPFRYRWLESVVDTLPILTNLRAGIYPVEIINSNGCITIDTVEITQPDTFNLSLSVVGTPCGSTTGQITAIIQGGEFPFTYEWSSSSDTDSIVTGLSPGIDTLLLTDANGCRLAAIGEVNSTSGIDLSSEVLSDVNCFPDSGGTARVYVTGGTSPFSYNWFPNVSDNDTAFNLPPQDYIITVIDSNGCRAKTSLKVISPPELKVELSHFNPSNDSTSDGKIKSIVLGGTPPYNYLWSNSQTSDTIFNLTVGHYDLVVTDANGCRRSGSKDLVTKPPFMACLTCPDLSTFTTCGPWTHIICSTCTSITKSIADFGGYPNDGNSDQCAFEEAASFFAAVDPNVIKTLQIPAGIYWVGAQYETPQWHRLGASVLCLEGIENLSIIGETDPGDPLNAPLSHIKFENCMKYGVFDVEHNPDNRLLGGASVNVTCSLTSGSNIVTLIGSTTDLFSTSYVVSGNSCLGNRTINQVLNSSQFTLDQAPSCSTGTYTLTITCRVGIFNYKSAATVGFMFHLSNCSNITIQNLDIDGNIDNAIIGGGLTDGQTWDGIQLPYTGIVSSSSKFITLNNLDVHHFGWDGLYVADPDCEGRYNPYVELYQRTLDMTNCKFRYNGRNGMSWTGGRNVSATNCDFTFTGQSRINMPPGAGLDIEYEASSYPPINGNFTDCNFMFNRNHGLISDAAAHGTAMRTGNYEYIRCNFIGSENGDAIWPNARNFSFTNCNFYGKVWNLYDARLWDQSHSLTNLDNAKFNLCLFSEEYLSPVGQVFSFSMTPKEVIPDVSNPGQFLAGPCPIGHGYLLDLSHAARAWFTNCNLNTNFTNRMAYITYPFAQIPRYNWSYFDNMTFHSGGLNECSCEPDLMVIQNCIIGAAGISIQYPNIFRNPGAACVSGVYTTVDYNFNICSPSMPLSVLDPRYADGSVLCGIIRDQRCNWCTSAQWESLREKYINPEVVNSAMPLYNMISCENSIQPSYSATCEPIESFTYRKAVGYLNISLEEKEKSLLKLTPNPGASSVLIENLEPNGVFIVSDVLGNILIAENYRENYITLDITNLVSGIYFFKSGEQKPVKFIKL